ncbi:ferredoxin [Meredithblackwellia eburnea MCA 4105]
MSLSLARTTIARSALPFSQPRNLATALSLVKRTHQQFTINNLNNNNNNLNLTRARQFHSSHTTNHGGKGRPKQGEGIKLIFKKSNGQVLEEVEANEGDDIVDVSWEYDLDIEAACEKSVACSTCHVILEPDVYDALEEPSDDENDMLDLAFGLTDTSRLGCQVKITKDMDGTTITLPSATRNLRVDGQCFHPFWFRNLLHPPHFGSRALPSVKR